MMLKSVVDFLMLGGVQILKRKAGMSIFKYVFIYICRQLISILHRLL